MAHLSDQFLNKVIASLQEEELDNYVLNLHYQNSQDLQYFKEKDREKIKSIFKILIQDTEKHIEILELISDAAS
jgi:hypothetical protein